MKTYPLATALLALGSLSAQAALVETLDFNNNQAPANWVFEDHSSGNHAVGFANGRFQANPVDSAGLIRRSYTGDAAASSLRFSWQGSVFQTFWGNDQLLTVANGAGDRWSVGAWSKNWHFGSGVRFFTLDDGQTYAQGSASGARPVNYNYVHDNFAAGTYDFLAEFTEGQVLFSGSLNGASIFSLRTSLTNFHLADLRSIEFYIAETTGATQWIDNLSVTETVSRSSGAAVPAPATLPLLLAALGIAGLAGRRREAAI